MASKDRIPTDVDREFVLYLFIYLFIYLLFCFFLIVFILLFTCRYFSALDENISPYLQKNVDTYAPLLANQTQHADFIEGNKKQSINGFMFGNLPVITLNQGDRVRWCILLSLLFSSLLSSLFSLFPLLSPLLSLYLALTYKDVTTLGAEMDVHAPAWASHTVTEANAREASTRLLSGTSRAIGIFFRSLLSPSPLSFSIHFPSPSPSPSFSSLEY
jgi:hypothetical protein